MASEAESGAPERPDDRGEGRDDEDRYALADKFRPPSARTPPRPGGEEHRAQRTYHEPEDQVAGPRSAPEHERQREDQRECGSF